MGDSKGRQRRAAVIAAGLAVLTGATAVVANTTQEDNMLLAAHGVHSADQRSVGEIAGSASDLRLITKGDTRCVLDSAEAAVCKTQAEIDDGYAIGTGECQTGLAENKMRILGIAPDGTTEVIVHYDNGDEYVATLVEGVWAADTPAPRVAKSLPTFVEFVGGVTPRRAIPVYRGAVHLAGCPHE